MRSPFRFTLDSRRAGGLATLIRVHHIPRPAFVTIAIRRHSSRACITQSTRAITGTLRSATTIPQLTATAPTKARAPLAIGLGAIQPLTKICRAKFSVGSRTRKPLSEDNAIARSTCVAAAGRITLSLVRPTG